MTTTSESPPPSASGAPSDAPSRPRDSGDAALRWWRRLTAPERGDPGTLAELRRCRSTGEAARIREAILLARMVGACTPGAHPARAADALDLARVLAHVREHTGTHPMRAAGWRTFAGSRRESDVGAGDRPVLSEVRFRRLLLTGGGEERVSAFARLVALLDRRVGVDDLARDFLRWTHPEWGDRVRERWAFLYYHAADAAPELPPEDPSPSLTDDEADA